MTVNIDIDDAIRLDEQRLVALRAVKERFPSARYRWNRLVAQDVWLVATDVEFEACAEKGCDPYVRLWCFVEIEGLRVYDAGGTQDLYVTLEWLRTKQPTAYARLVDAVARSAITRADGEKR